MHLPDWARRALRTLVQGLPPAGLIAAWGAFVAPLTPEQIGGAMLLLTAGSSALMNAIEEHSSVPALLKSPTADRFGPGGRDGG